MIKKYHVSKNLWNATIVQGAVGENGDLINSSTRVRGEYIPVQPETQYTISCNKSIRTIYAYLNQAKVDVIYKNSLQRTTVPFRTPANCDSICVGFMNAPNTADLSPSDIEFVMLNTGSQPLPYEPYGNTWNSIPYRKYGTETDTITTLPADIYANGTTATVEVKGNMSQSSVPSPSSPVMPQETGERTGNLAPPDWAADFVQRVNKSDKAYISNNILHVFAGAGYQEYDTKYVFKTDWKEDTQYTFNLTYRRDSIYTNSTMLQIRYTDNTTAVFPRTINDGEWHTIYVTSETNKTIKDLSVWYSSNWLEIEIDSFFVYEGTVEKPYEPYGYKIPILCGGTTTNVYLGEVQSERQIYKMVFDGTENWQLSSDANIYILIATNRAVAWSTIVSSHFTKSQIQTNGALLWFVNRNVDFGTVEECKTYLQQQYSAGTPVCVWYVLAEPTTTTLNEPIRKIGDYADGVSVSNIPTTGTAESFDIDTDLKPSEVDLTYHGWHPVADVHVYPDSSWMPTSWEEFRKAVRSGKAQSLYPVGTKLYENWGDTTSDAWIVVDYPTGEDYLDSDLAQQGYTNRVMLMEEKLNYLRQFDAIEAWLYVETAIPAGTYRFTIPNHDASYGGNKTYIFTSTANVPVGGQLTLTWVYQQNPSAVQAYSSATSTSALFNVSITEWDGTTACTDLGTIKLAQNDADSTYGKLNHIHRARYGSNNYAQSGYRQWLNTNASANWWTPTNVFDRPYGNRTNAGRLNVMNSNMKSVLATPTVNCITNNLFEYPSLDGTTFSLQTAYTVTDKLFPVTHSEINLSSSPNVNSVLDYYVGKGNADRIKYRKDNGNAYYWWLRTPLSSYAISERHVNTSGALNSGYSSSSYGSAAACIIQ